MKKLFYAFLVLGFISCSSDDDKAVVQIEPVVTVPETPGDDTPPAEEETPEEGTNPDTSGEILGKWYYVNSEVNGIVTPYDDHEECGKDYIEFYDTNKVRQVDVWFCQEDIEDIGTFTKNGNQLTITSEGESSTSQIYELTATSLVLTYSYDDNGDGINEVYYERFDR